MQEQRDAACVANFGERTVELTHRIARSRAAQTLSGAAKDCAQTSRAEDYFLCASAELMDG
jgi:hypothetical protein